MPGFGCAGHSGMVLVNFMVIKRDAIYEYFIEQKIFLLFFCVLYKGYIASVDACCNWGGFNRRRANLRERVLPEGLKMGELDEYGL